MNQPNTGLVRSLARGALIALLMTSTATAALAAPKATRLPPRPPRRIRATPSSRRWSRKSVN